MKVPREISDDAWGSVCLYSISAACTSGITKFFIPIPWIDVAPLTWITKKMSEDVTNIYGYKSLTGISQFTGVIVGAATGAKLGTEVLSIIPFAGAGANAIATFSIHMLTGICLMITFESMIEGNIDESIVRNTPAAFISTLLGTATDVVGDFVRGDVTGALTKAKSEIQTKNKDVPDVFKPFVR
jgi:uncharacterized protein (DUF697 family)